MGMCVFHLNRFIYCVVSLQNQYLQKPSRSKKLKDGNGGIPSLFITHLERAKYEKRMTKGKEMELPEDSETVKSFLHRVYSMGK